MRVHVCACACVFHAMTHMWRSGDKLAYVSSLLKPCELRPTGLAPSTFTSWAVWLPQSSRCVNCSGMMTFRHVYKDEGKGFGSHQITTFMCERLLEAFLCFDLEWNVCLSRSDCELKMLILKVAKGQNYKCVWGDGNGDWTSLPAASCLANTLLWSCFPSLRSEMFRFMGQ